MHRISVVVRCAVENLPEPDWQRLKPFGWQRWKRPWLEGVVLVGKASGNGRVCSRSHGLFFLEMRIVHSYLKLSEDIFKEAKWGFIVINGGTL